MLEQALGGLLAITPRVAFISVSHVGLDPTGECMHEHKGHNFCHFPSFQGAYQAAEGGEKK